MQTGLYSRSIEFSWMLKSAMVQVMQQTGVVSKVLQCRLMTEAEL